MHYIIIFVILLCNEKEKGLQRHPRKVALQAPPKPSAIGERFMTSITHPLPSRMTQNVAALFGHADDTLVTVAAPSGWRATA